jgi:hypothetical protein
VMACRHYARFRIDMTGYGCRMGRIVTTHSGA